MSNESPATIQAVQAAETIQPAPERRILRRPEVEARTGFGRSQIYKMMKAGLFPKAKPLGIRTVGWDSFEIQRWIDERLKTPV